MGAAVRGAAGFVAALVFVGASLAGCGGDDDKADGPTSPAPGGSAPASSAPAAAPTGGVYKAAEKLCDVVDTSGLKDIFPTIAVEGQQSRPSAAFTMLQCSLSTKSSTASGLLQMEADVFGQPRAQAQFEGLKGVEKAAKTDIPGLGSGAYSYNDDLTGPHVVAYDGNLYISVGWSAVSRDAEPPADIIERLTRVVRGTMAALRSS